MSFRTSSQPRTGVPVPEVGENGTGTPGFPQYGMAATLVEEHGQRVRVVEQPCAACVHPRPGRPRGRDESFVPDGRALDPRRILDIPQPPLDLGILTRRVQPHQLARTEFRSPAQHIQPRHHPRLGHPGAPQRVLEHGHAPVARVAHHGKARRPRTGHSATAV
ncbi:hypothetical protein [Nocardia sp. NPDC051981]|uniref:hypothetical protein n=1 Tax=Nocardia sp. NPDC051981 TaxID=3155417 RepID=UPI0034391071